MPRKNLSKLFCEQNISTFHPAETVRKYLNKYQYGKYGIEKNFSSTKRAVVVIPCYSEFRNLPALLESLNLNSSGYLNETAFLFVINNSSECAETVRKNNADTLDFFREIISHPENRYGKLNIAIVDAATGNLAPPPKLAGVGLARKIGMDAALSLLGEENFKEGIIVALDADCTVSDNYLEEIFIAFSQNPEGFAIFNYEHTFSDENGINDAITAYEIFLRYYVLGLRFANSHYALHTIGSAFACRPALYIKCEGMNKLKAGEDFYFIEKMAKQSGYKYIKEATVFPSPRPSKRVPFGTGRAVLNYLGEPEKRDLLYDPLIFSILKEWLKVYDEFTENPEAILCKASGIHNALGEFLKMNKFTEHWNKIIRKAASGTQLTFQKKIWFDGFKTLKFVHYMRDTHFPNIPYSTACRNLLTLMDLRYPEAETQVVNAENSKLSLLNLLRELT